MKPNLNKVTLICVDCSRHAEAVAAIRRSMQECDFAAVKFLTDREFEIEGIEVINILPIRSKEQYSEFIIKELWKYIDTEFCLVIQRWEQESVWCVGASSGIGLALVNELLKKVQRSLPLLVRLTLRLTSAFLILTLPLSY